MTPTVSCSLLNLFCILISIAAFLMTVFLSPLLLCWSCLSLQLSTSFPAESSPRPQNDPCSTVAATEPSLILDDTELEQFVDKQKNCNTKRKIESDLRHWYSWYRSVGETREIGEIPPAELDQLLGHFYVKVCKTNGEMYEPDNLTALQRSIDCRLSKDLHKPYSIIRDQQFASSRDKLNAARKSLKKAGKGNKPQAAETLEAADIQSLWSHGLLGD